MLQRVYGTAFTNREELDAYLARIEEAKKRDHRKLGRQLDLFDIREEGPGFPFFYPKGMVLRNQLEDYWREIHRKHGYEEIETPIMLNRSLWERSGHWDHYQENMYTTKTTMSTSPSEPMNCPGGIAGVRAARCGRTVTCPCASGELGPGAPARAVRARCTA